MKGNGICGLVCALLASVLGCGGIRRTVSAAAKVPAMANVRLASPEMAAALKPALTVFVPQFEFFLGPQDAWGKDKRLGALWAYNPTDGAAVDGLAVIPSSGVALLETPKGRDYSHVLRRLDFGGRTISSNPLSGFFTSMDAGNLGGRAVLLARNRQSLKVVDCDGLPLWKDDLAAAQAVLADLDGDGRGELVAGSGEQGAVAAIAADGGKLWTREGLQQVYGLAAGRIGQDRRESVAVFAGSPGASNIVILDGQGRTAAVFSDETAPERGVFLRAEGRAAYLAHVGSRFQNSHDRLRISRLEGGTRTITAEADIGPTHVVSLIAADFNGDGRKEVALGTDNGWVFVYDENARLLGEKHHFGPVPHLAAGDVSGDGIDDLLVGARDSASHVYAYGVVPKPGPLGRSTPIIEKP